MLYKVNKYLCSTTISLCCLLLTIKRGSIRDLSLRLISQGSRSSVLFLLPMCAVGKNTSMLFTIRSSLCLMTMGCVGNRTDLIRTHKFSMAWEWTWSTFRVSTVESNYISSFRKSILCNYISILHMSTAVLKWIVNKSVSAVLPV